MEAPCLCAGRSQLQPGGQFVEAVLGEPFAITCRLCSTPTATATNAALRVDWQKEGVPVAESAEVRSFRRSRGEFVLRIRRMREDQLGNYTCILSEGGQAIEEEAGGDVGGGTRRDVEVSLLPPPPTWEPEEDGVGRSLTSRVWRWRGQSSRPIINYQLEVRRRPEDGRGEDWLSIVIPYRVRHIYFLNNHLI